MLRIPSIEIEVLVLEGTHDLTFNRAVGHIDGTAAPGEEGNIGIAGHRDGFFRGLKDVHLGEYVDLYTERGNTRYIVDEIRIVPPEDVSVLAPRPRSSITLVTCYPFYFVGVSFRFIVHASTTSAINLRAPRPRIHSEDRGVRDSSSAGQSTDLMFGSSRQCLRVPRPGRAVYGMWGFPAKVVTEADGRGVGYILSLRIHGVAEPRFHGTRSQTSRSAIRHRGWRTWF